MTERVVLNWFELYVAGEVGVLRRIEALKGGRSDARYGKPTLNPWNRGIEGAAAEMTIAKFTNQYWHALGPKPWEIKADVGNDIQVRQTDDPSLRLIVHDDDPDDQFFYLMTGEAPNFTMHGPIRGADCKRKEWWIDPGTGRPAFFVPQSALK